MYLMEDKLHPFRFDKFNIDQFISDLDPKIWSFICELTKSTSECKGVSKISDPNSQVSHVKKNPSFFLSMHYNVYYR